MLLFLLVDGVDVAVVGGRCWCWCCCLTVDGVEVAVVVGRQC